MVLFVIGAVIIGVGTYSGFIYVFVSKGKMFCSTCSDNSKREKFVNERVVLKVRLDIFILLSCASGVDMVLRNQKPAYFSKLKSPHFSFSQLFFGTHQSKRIKLIQDTCFKRVWIKIT
jgi:hypothetical protein